MVTPSQRSFPNTEESGGDPTLMVSAPPGPEEAVLQRGQSVGRYMVLDRIGAGGMAVVYAAYDPELERKVAIKLLKHSPDEGTLAGSRGGGRSRALREAQALAKLSHPNVLPIYDVGTLDDQVFLATEFVNGKTLRDWLKDDRPPWREVVRIFRAAGRGLAAAHAQGIVHRDFKPHNVMIGEDGTVRVMDFGLARRSSDAQTAGSNAATVSATSLPRSDEASLDSALTQTGVIAGTPVYMAPEQHDGMDVDARADQFSFCVALYEGIYGHRPFAKTAEQTALEAKRAHRLAPLSAAALRRGPRWIRRILVRGLAPDPEHRWPSMDALLSALEDSPWARTRRWAVAGVVVSALAGGSAYAQWQRSAMDRICQGGTERIEAIWSAARRDDIGAAFADTGVSSANGSWSKVRETIDAYAASWATMHREACEATQVFHEQSNQAMDLRMTCLQQRYWELESLLDVLARPNAEVAENAVVAATRLAPLDPCADLAALQAEVPPPASPALQAKVETLQKRLAKVLAIYNTGDVTRALELAEDLADDAESVEYPPVRADILARLGIFQQTAGLHKDAEQTLTKAAWLAIANKMFMVAARVEAYLVHVVGYALERHEEGLQWAGHAEAILAAGGGDGDRASHIMMNRANVLFRKGDLQGSYALQVEALRLREAHFGPDHPEVIMTLSNAGALARNTDRVEEAVSYFRRAIEIGEEHLGPDHPQLAFPLLNLSTALMEKGDLEAADEGLSRALEIWRQSTGPRNVHIAQVNLRRSILREYQGRIDEAATLVEDALNIREELLGREHPQVADALRRLGEVREAQGRHAEALDAYQEALAMFQRKDPESREVLHSQLGLGRTLVSLGRDAEAIEVLQAALGAPESKISPEVSAEIHFALAKGLWESDRRDLALDHARRAADALADRNGFRSKTRRREVTEWAESHRVPSIRPPSEDAGPRDPR